MAAGSRSVDDQLAAIVQPLHINYAPDAELDPANGHSNQDATASAPGEPGKSLPGALNNGVLNGGTHGGRVESLAAAAGSVGGVSEGKDYAALSSRTHTLSREVAALLDRLYQIQELRHASPLPSAQLDPVLASLAATIPVLRQNLVQLQSDVYAYPGREGRDLADGVEEVSVEYKKAEEEWRALKEGVKEDDWVGEFKTMADQAEGMMESLQKSLAECKHYLDRITRSSAPIPDRAELEDQPSVRGLEKLVRDHESLKRAYMPSANRMLKKMDKDITERHVKNGAALRRFNEMGQRWLALQTQLYQLDTRVQRVLSQITAHPTMELLASASASTDDMEFLADDYPPSEYAGRALPRSAGGASTGYGHGHAGGQRTPRSSISSSLSASSARSLTRRAGQQEPPSSFPGIGSKSSPGAGGAAPGSTTGRTLTRRTSLASIGSATTSATAAATSCAPGDRPRWNTSPQVVHDPVVAVPSGPWQTPTTSRTVASSPSVGVGVGAGRGARVCSPTPSSSSVVSGAGSRRLSRLPLYSPKGPRSSTGGGGAGGGARALSPKSDTSDMGYKSVPGLSLPPPTTPGGSGRGGHGGHGASHLERARMGLKTPEPLAGGRPRLSSSFSALQPRLSAGGTGGPPTPSTPATPGHGRSYSTPRTAPALGARAGGRPSMSARAPPSSFQSPTPTPSARPSSRLSVMSYAAADTRPGAPPLQPFSPSPYDHLDQLVWAALVEEGFDKNFVTYRLDAPLRRGQRMREGEEWKGEFQFGAGERVTPVKVLSLGGRRAGEGKREKVMVRTGGKWVELVELLRKRMDVMEVME